MTPDQQQREERHAALMAVAHALTEDERQQLLAAVGRWPRMRGAAVADILDLTTSQDMFLDQTEPFFEQFRPVLGWFPKGPAVLFAAHVVSLLGRPLVPGSVADILTRAGVMEGCPDGGACHHGCRSDDCFRVQAASPLGAAGFEGDRWPEHIVARNRREPEPAFEHGRQLTAGERNELRHLLQVLSEDARTVRNAVEPVTGAYGFSVGQWCAQWRDLKKHIEAFTEKLEDS